MFRTGFPVLTNNLNNLIIRSNDWLVVLIILKNDGVRQWGWDDIPYIMENNPFISSHHQPVIITPH